MAVPQFNLQHQTHRYCNQSKFLSVFRPNTPSHLTVNTNFRFPNSIKPPNIRYECFHFHIPNSGSAKDLSAPNIPKAEVLERWVIFMRSVLPGGSWWNLSDSNEVGSKAREAKPVTVLLALRRIWALVADDRWVIYAALVSLTIVAWCAKWLLWNGKYDIAGASFNVLQLKRLRETLFAALIFQDLSFFDKEAVGDLTSRLGADCQRLSRVIENDIHMILRSSLRVATLIVTLFPRLPFTFKLGSYLKLNYYFQGIGALINLLTLSWPLAFSTLVICSVLSLTSRLGADCQRLSHVIENDIHMILRSSLRVATLIVTLSFPRLPFTFKLGFYLKLNYYFQGIGALINLLTLSWPLAFSTLVICSVLSTIFLFYGQFQKKVAKFTQEYSASANEAARGTFSLIRTVRVYGTEEEELGRYKQWLDKLVYIGIRESVAYGSWYLSFNTLYRSTQVFAVLLGGMSVLTGHVSAEQLMKYVLYCEWLIYAAWRLEDNLSSLLQAIGASEKITRAAPVRNLLNLLSPIHEDTCLIFFLSSFVGFTSIAFNVTQE
ncbi:hypothetical protein TEA_026572 [Camellia sinensis var. sinensis]|uniref:ABC transmembrane type-1 domain-containing protein n=1 Tax=Camellia sinensis var. sinensis TaxID=542762 RepID=A0A4S4DML8_CAMSN|nr:hypothetical protein TEA_026572 [Camellia sinensis var. sinensis]